jgi:hypothetical protein
MTSFLIWLLFHFGRGGDILVVIYVALIVNGRRTFAQVPESQKPAVHNELLALGLDDNGIPLELAV